MKTFFDFSAALIDPDNSSSIIVYLNNWVMTMLLRDTILLEVGLLFNFKEVVCAIIAMSTG